MATNGENNKARNEKSWIEVAESLEELKSTQKVILTEVEGVKEHLRRLNGSVARNTAQNNDNSHEIAKINVGMEWMNKYYDERNRVGEKRDEKTEDRMKDFVKNAALPASLITSATALVGVIIKLIQVLNEINNVVQHIP